MKWPVWREEVRRKMPLWRRREKEWWLFSEACTPSHLHMTSDYEVISVAHLNISERKLFREPVQSSLVEGKQPVWLVILISINAIVYEENREWNSVENAERAEAYVSKKKLCERKWLYAEKKAGCGLAAGWSCLLCGSASAFSFTAREAVCLVTCRSSVCRSRRREAESREERDSGKITTYLSCCSLFIRRQKLYYKSCWLKSEGSDAISVLISVMEKPDTEEACLQREAQAVTHPLRHILLKACLKWGREEQPLREGSEEHVYWLCGLMLMTAHGDSEAWKVVLGSVAGRYFVCPLPVPHWNGCPVLAAIIFLSFCVYVAERPARY